MTTRTQASASRAFLQKMLFAAAALVATVPTALAEPATKAELPKQLELLSKDEVDAYCATMLGSLARTLAKSGNREDLSYEFFTTQTLLIYEIVERGVPEELVKASVSKYYSNKPIKEAFPYCRELGQAAYDRASAENRERAGDRAYTELKKFEQQR